jgi:AraC-like DNA-binding protein
LNFDKQEEYINYVLNSTSDFSLHIFNRGEKVSIKRDHENCIIFIISGKIGLKKDNYKSKIFNEESMFFVSADNTLYYLQALENTKIIFLKITNIPLFYKKLSLDKISNYCPQERIELEAIGIEENLYYFLHGIILYFRNNISCIHFNDIKKDEFFLIMKSFYEKKTLARFLSSIILNQSDFINTVIKKYTPTCSVEELASNCNMSAKTLTRKFKEQFNTTPYQWLMQQRNEAIKIKIDQGEPMQQIADDFNFPSLELFVRYCKKNIE